MAARASRGTRSGTRPAKSTSAASRSRWRSRSASCAFRATDGDQTWGIDVLRFRPRTQRARISNNAQDRNLSCYLCQFGKFTGFANAEPGKALEVVPTLTSTRTDSRPPAPAAPGELEHGDFETEAGLGVRWGITPDLTLDLTLNPDFSQVEADVAQLEENDAVRIVLSRDAAILPRGRGLLLEPAAGRVHTHRCGPRRGCEVHGPNGQQHDRRVRDERYGHEPAVPGAVRLADDFARPRERRVRRAVTRAGSAGHRRSARS